MAGLEPGAAILRIRFGDLGLINGDWEILGKIPEWVREAWPMPGFVRRDLLGIQRPTRAVYADDDPARIEAE
jgi:hypothetical protein